MNDKKISFIIAVNNETLYNQTISYINNLSIPSGFEVEILAVINATSLTSAYNEGMRSSEAKYKIYLHQDVFITNKNFLNEIIDLFKKDSEIGMIGACGAVKMSSNGVWWESKEKVGMVIHRTIKEDILLKFSDVNSDYVPVCNIDGLIMITQYDIPWRDDVFDNWHFYDMSQSMEFLKAGYKVVVHHQTSPWYIHYINDRHSTSMITYEKYKILYLQTYSELLKSYTE